jgi:hypothetical protein
MNIIKQFIKKLKKQYSYVEKQLDNADIIVGEGENLTREQRKRRFDAYYEKKDKKSWEKARNAHKKRTI